MSFHVKVLDQLILREAILQVDCAELERHLRVKVYTRDSGLYVVEGQQALDLVMDLRPAMIEGKRFRVARHAWAFHNLVAHPTLQVLAWLGQAKLGFRLHDATIPRPKGKTRI